MKYKAFESKTGERTVIITGGPETFVIHANNPITTLHPVSGPDPELRASMERDWMQEPTKEEWLRERGIPIPGSDEDRARPRQPGE